MLLIFDLDGTLLDTVADLGNAANHALTQLHYPEHPTSDYVRFVGNGVRKLCERALPENTSEQEVDEMLALFQNHYDAHCMDDTTPYPGMIEALSQLKDGNILAVASNKPQLFTEKLVTHFFGNQFDIILGSNDTRPRKPAPDILNEIMLSCKIPPDQTLLIGDSETDIQTANNADIRAITCTWGFRTTEQLLAAGAEILVHTSEQMCEVLHNLGA